MEKHLSQNELQKFYNKEVKSRGKEEIEKAIEEKRSTEKDSKKRKSIFLCHSHLDKTIVTKIALLFDKVDFHIYIDWMDEGMPKVTDKNTASMIRDKIQHCHKFLFLATSRGLQSKWCDWELGIAYSLKDENEIAILPIESYTGRWDGSEYMKLYPVMTFDHTDLEMVNIDNVKIQGDRKKTSLQEWLR